MAYINPVIEVEQGSTFVKSWYFFSPDPSGLGNPGSQVPFDFTGCHARMTFRTSDTASATELLTLIDTGPSPGIVFSSGSFTDGPAVPAAPNGWTITITATQSLAIAAAPEYYYDMFVDFPNSTHTLFMKGVFVVYPTVTR